METHNELEYILAECCFAVGQNIGDHRITPEAARFWWDRYRERFSATLSREHPRVWREDRQNVLAKAAALGRVAVELATADGSLIIDEVCARRASEANDCRPRTRYGLFSIWCVPPSESPEADYGEPSRSWATTLAKSLIPTHS